MHDTHRQPFSTIKKTHRPHSVLNSRLISLPEVLERVSLSRTSIYNRMNDGTFPKSVKLGPRAIAWQESSIDEWIAARVGFSQAEEVRS